MSPACFDDEILFNGVCISRDDLPCVTDAECEALTDSAPPDAYVVEMRVIGSRWASVALLLLVVWAIIATLLLWDAYQRRNQ